MGIHICNIGGRLIRYIPLKSIKERWCKLYVSSIINAHVSSNTLADLLVEIGSYISSQYKLFNDLMHDSIKLAFDLYSIFSRSENINMAKNATTMSMNIYRRSILQWYSIWIIISPRSLNHLMVMI